LRGASSRFQPSVLSDLPLIFLSAKIMAKRTAKRRATERKIGLGMSLGKESGGREVGGLM